MSTEPKPESPAELAAEANWLVGEVIADFYRDTLREHQLLEVIKKLAALATIQASASASQPVAKLEPEPEPEPEPMFYGHWHHGNGNLCCGTMRYFRADFDTNPAPDVREAIFDWVCTTMNAALDRWRDQKRARETAEDKQ